MALIDLERLQSSEVGDLVRGLSGWRDKIRDFLGFVLLSPKGVARDGVSVPVSPASVVVPFSGSDLPSRVLVSNVRASGPAAVAQLPAQKGDRGPRLTASAACTVDVWMVP